MQDDFSNDLSKWTTVQGTGFTITGGELANSTSGEQIMVNSSTKTLTDGIITVDEKWIGSAYADASIVVRYQDANNLYLVHPHSNGITIYERLSGTYSTKAVGNIALIVPGQSYRLQVTVESGTISAYWNGAFVTQWTGATRWSSGKVGFRKWGSSNVRWDNITVTTGGPGKIASSDDYDVWGMVLEGRSTNLGQADARYKFIGEELDVETGYWALGPRFYDGRIGVFRGPDPLDQYHSPYTYAGDNPIGSVDPSGLWSEDFRDNVIATKYFDERGKLVYDDEIDNELEVYTTQKIIDSHTSNGETDWDAVRNDPGSNWRVNNWDQFWGWYAQQNEAAQLQSADRILPLLFQGALLGRNPEAEELGELNEDVIKFVISMAPLGGTKAPKILQKFGRYLFRPGGLLNSNRYLRIGLGRKGGDEVFRIAGKWVKKLPSWMHNEGKIDLWNFGPIKPRGK